MGLALLNRVGTKPRGFLNQADCVLGSYYPHASILGEYFDRGPTEVTSLLAYSIFFSLFAIPCRINEQMCVGEVAVVGITRAIKERGGR